MKIPALLCEHSAEDIRVRGFRAVCGTCQSYWDLDSISADVVYDDSYPTDRGHFDPRVGKLKVRTLCHWLEIGKVQLDGKRVCEVGFGGGTCLPAIAERARRVVGIETNAATIEHVRAAGTAADLFLVSELPPLLDEPIDLWVFQDAFEHIPDPAPFVRWMRENSTPGSEILVVAPRGDSFSRKLMGRLWIHKLPDHLFHWSKQGLIDFMAARDFAVSANFYPLKFISPQMAVAHALHKAGVAGSARKWLGGTALAVPFNFGEMGLVFRLQ
jgi:SAM-dependent methyltransferase